jgi:uncharacterized cupin superfamily protein
MNFLPNYLDTELNDSMADFKLDSIPQLKCRIPTPDDLKLSATWKEWAHEVGVFTNNYTKKECFILTEGIAFITMPKYKQMWTIEANTYVEIPAGVECQWDAILPIKKVYIEC